MGKLNITLSSKPNRICDNEPDDDDERDDDDDSDKRDYKKDSYRQNRHVKHANDRIETSMTKSKFNPTNTKYILLKQKD